MSTPDSPYHHSSSIGSTPPSAPASTLPSFVPITIPLPPSSHTYRRSNLVHLSPWPASPPPSLLHGHRRRVVNDTGMGRSPLLSAVDLLPEQMRTRSGSGRQQIDGEEGEVGVSEVSFRPGILHTPHAHTPTHAHTRSSSSNTSNTPSPPHP